MEREKVNKRTVGALGEQAAADAYVNDNYRITGRNIHLGKFGEIDIALTDENNEYLVICEVKLRKDKSYGDASLAVNYKKQNKLRTLAKMYIEKFPEYQNMNVRFDIAEVYNGENGDLLVNIIENAF